MKTINNKFKFHMYKAFGVLILISAILAGCGAKDAVADDQNAAVVANNIIHQPDYTEVAFGTNKDDLFASEGNPNNTYPSGYEGETYQYDNKEYQGLIGSNKYMTDSEGNVVCMAWMYVSDDSETIKKSYDDLHAMLVEKYGKGDNESTQAYNCDDIWYLDDVHIQISAVTTTDFCGLQISYLDAKYSLKDIVDAKKAAREAEEK